MSFDLGSAVGKIVLDTKGFNKSLVDAKKNLNEFLHEQQTDKKMKALGGSIEKVGATATKAITVPLSGALAFMGKTTMDMEQAVRSYSKATGDSLEVSRQYKDAIGNIFKQGIGESFEDIANSMALVRQQMQLSGEELTTVSKRALQLRDTFDIDVNEGVRGAKALMDNFGLSAEEAYNYIAIGAQNGLNQNQDLADQISEYSVYYSEAGASAKEMFDAIYTGTQNGVFQIDYLNDAYKEFGIRAKDTADSTTEGYQLLGLNADEMRAKFAQGGESAQEVFRQVVQALAETDDEVLQNQAGVDLFGTKWEDLGQKAIMGMTEMNSSLDVSKDAFKEMDELTFDDLSRSIQVLGESFGRVLLPYLIKGIEKFTQVTDAINDLDPKTKDLVVKFGLLVASIGPVLTVGGKLIKDFKTLKSVISVVLPFILKTGKFIAGLTNPVTIAITAVTLLYVAYKKNLFGLKDLTDNTVKNLKGKWNDFKTYAPKVAKDFITGLANGIKNGVGAVGTAIKNLGKNMISGLRKVIDSHSPSKEAERIGLDWDYGLGNGVTKGSSYVSKTMDYLGNLLMISGNKIQNDFVLTGSNGVQKLTSKIYDGSMKIIGIYEKERNKRVSLMQKGTDANVDQIQKEIDATRKAYDIKMSLYQQEFNAKMALVDEETRKEIEGLQGKIDAIDELNEMERRAEEEADYQERLSAKEKEIELAETEEEKKKKKLELDEIIRDREKVLTQQRRRDEQNELREQIDEARKRAEEKKKAMQEEFEEKQIKLQQQREAELAFMVELQELLKEDLTLRKELYETQQKIATEQEKLKTKGLSKEERQQTLNEIRELQNREKEIKDSLNRNETTFKNFTPTLQNIGNEYGRVLTGGILSSENTIYTFLNNILSKANSVLSSIRQAKEEAESLDNPESSKSSRSVKTNPNNNTVNNNNTYNFYSNEKMTPTEISRQFKKTQKDLAMGF